MSTTTTVMDNNNGSVLTPPVKVGKKSVTEDIMTTFSSPAAWLLVVALIVTWSAVAIIMFDLVDYKTFAGSSVNKLSKEPLRIIHQTMEESTDWLYGFISLLSDIVSTDDDDSDEGICDIQTLIHKEKPEKQEKIERKEQPKGKCPKKAKSTKVEEKVKKEVKDGKAESKTAEKGKQTEAKVEDIGLIKAKPKVKEEKAVKAETKSEKKGKQNQEETAEDPKRVVGKKQRQ
uniref:Triadin n=1 Tax=Terrapene triunguis TaxID=2587831 RepID=A0A674HWV9_9SAUR